MRDVGQLAHRLGGSLADSSLLPESKLMIMCGRFAATVVFNLLAEQFGITVEDPEWAFQPSPSRAKRL